MAYGKRVAKVRRSRKASEFVLEGVPLDATLASNGHDWHIVSGGFPQAWAALGGPGGIDWDGVQVGQIDTGYTEHPCLGWRKGRSASVRQQDGRNFFTAELQGEQDPFVQGNHDPASALDPFSGANGGHGTRTASVLAGFDERAAAKRLPLKAGDRSRRVTLHGYYGAAPKVPYVPIRLSNCVMIDNVTVELGFALEHLLEHARCQVITLSMGAAGPFGLPQKTRDMIDLAYRRGVIVCCAAGNAAPFVVAPARGPRTVAIGGCAPGDKPWVGSSFGRDVDICAPAWPVRRADTLADGRFVYGFGDGTSYATPQVAGTAALWLVKHRAALANTYREPWMRVAAFLHLLKATGRRPSGWDAARYGVGILDAAALLRAPLPDAAALVQDVEPHSARPGGITDTGGIADTGTQIAAL
jgi:hypothetical protein